MRVDYKYYNMSVAPDFEFTKVLGPREALMVMPDPCSSSLSPGLGLGSRLASLCFGAFLYKREHAEFRFYA